jgi:uncharacterized protein (DUF58 family)
MIDFWDRTTFYLNKRVYYSGFTACCLFILSYFIAPLFGIAVLCVCLLMLLVLIDTLYLYQQSNAIHAKRLISDRFSNGDENTVLLRVRNDYRFKVHGTVIDELPFQFQERNWKRFISLSSGETTEIVYRLIPRERGTYVFGNVNVYVQGPLGLATRRYTLEKDREVKVYPSYVQMRRYQLLAAAASLPETGMKQMRKLGHSMEFEQIKEYVRGDDYRTINWKATARRGDLMVNTFTDERSQQIYCLINKGRVMKMPFDGLSLLDYAINAALVVSNTALQKQDKAGLITFAQQVDTFLLADKKPTQISHILESLYRQETNFMEPAFEKLFSAVRNRITQRSLLILFTNFESMESMQRELPVLKRLAHYHLLMVVFFENTELKELTEADAKTTEDIYIKTIAEKYRYEKYLITKELQKLGIIAVLSTPQKLTINTMNKYLELKNRMSI